MRLRMRVRRNNNLLSTRLQRGWERGRGGRGEGHTMHGRPASDKASAKWGTSRRGKKAPTTCAPTMSETRETRETREMRAVRAVRAVRVASG